MTSTFEKLLLGKLEVYRRKNADYAGDRGTYFNFEQAAKVAEPFDDPVDRVFATLIGVKMARLAVLRRSGAAPNHESVQDTHLDLANYAQIWEAYRADQEGRKS